MSAVSPALPIDEDLRPALEALAQADADIARAYEVCGLPPPRSTPGGFDGLFRIIACQQVSAGAARAILTKLEGALGAFTPDAFVRHDETSLRALGLSRQKARYSLAMAEAARDGVIDFERLAELDDEAAIEHLTQLKGVGRWTAEIYLLFALGRPDVFPAGDLALQVAAQRLKRLRKRPDDKRLRRLAGKWRPHRGAAARFLWHVYRHPGMPG